MTTKLMHEKQVAEYLAVSISWLQRARWQGDGPQYIKYGHAVRYKQSDIDEWIDSRKRISTTDQGEQ